MSRIELSYHRYEWIPSKDFEKEWSATLEIDVLGTLYESETHHSPAAEKIEFGWDKLWIEGRPSWHTVLQLIND